jgi:plastocyanin
VNSTTWIGALALSGVLAVAGCGGGDNGSGGGGGAAASGSGSSGSSGSSSSSGSSGGGSKLRLAADPSGQLKFTTSRLTAKAGTVTIDFSNQSSVPHAVAVEGHGIDKDGQTITKGSNSLTVKLKPGKYEFYCPVDGHRQAGMEGTLIVK